MLITCTPCNTRNCRAFYMPQARSGYKYRESKKRCGFSHRNG
nr:MAG TPA: DNL zinc finger protein [Siphoviridae sp. cthRu26]